MSKRNLRVAAVCAGILGVVVTAGAGSASAGTSTVSGSYDPAAYAPRPVLHRGGLDVSKIPPAAQQKATVVGSPEPVLPVTKVAANTLPAAVSMEKWAPTPGQQGNVGSCVAWAVTYSGYGTTMRWKGVPGFPMAPMYAYAQIVRGNDTGTYGKAVLDVAVKQGIAPRSVYKQGDFDYWSQPTDAQRKEAAKYKLSGYKTIPVRGAQTKQMIMESISKGMPVVIGMNVYSDIDTMPAATAKSYRYRPSGGYTGGHEVTIIGYSSAGVRIQNSWGPTWGDKGRYNLSWSYLLNSGDLLEAYAMGKVKYTGAPGPKAVTPAQEAANLRTALAPQPSTPAAAPTPIDPAPSAP